MPYDPNFPTANTLADADQVRAQFNGLNDKIELNAATNITSVVVDSVTTLDPDQPATVNVSVSGNTLHLAFGIPRGGTGATGGDGPQGVQGPQGATGEVSNADLSNAVNTTSANSNSVPTLSFTASGSYDASELQNVIERLNALITALRR